MTSTSDLDRQNEENYRGLMVSIRAGQGRLNLLIAVCDDPDYREEIIDRYQKQLASQVRSYRVELDREEPSLRAAVASVVEKDEYLQNGGKAVVTVTGAEGLFFLNRDGGRSQQEIFFGYLQWTREALRQFPFTIVLWLTNQLESKVRERARDFWSWRKGVFRFQCHRKQALSREDVAPFASFLGREFAETDDDDPHFLPVADLQGLIEKIEGEKGVEDRRLATLYQRLGRVYKRRVRLGEYEDYRQEQERAIECFEKAIKLQRKFDKEIDLADSLNYLAQLYYSQNRQAEAETLLLEAIEIDRKALPKDHPSLASHLNNLALLYYSQNRLAEAERLYLEAIEIYRKALPKDHPSLATGLNNLAGLYYSQNRLAEAERLYLEAIEIDRKALPKDHPSLATSLNNLAGLYHSQNRLVEAEPLYLEAIEIDRKALPKDHPEFATHLNGLAALYQRQNRQAEAEPLFLEAIDIVRKALPKDHPQLATHLNNLALLYYSQNRFAEAEPLFLEAIDIDRKALPKDHPYLATHLNNLALLYKSQNRLAEAERLYLEAIEIDRKALPKDHPDLAKHLNGLALLYKSQNRLAEAERLYLEAIEIDKKALPKDHPYDAKVEDPTLRSGIALPWNILIIGARGFVRVWQRIINN